MTLKLDPFAFAIYICIFSNSSYFRRFLLSISRLFFAICFNLLVVRCCLFAWTFVHFTFCLFAFDHMHSKQIFEIFANIIQRLHVEPRQMYHHLGFWSASSPSFSPSWSWSSSIFLSISIAYYMFGLVFGHFFCKTKNILVIYDLTQLTAFVQSRSETFALNFNDLGCAESRVPALCPFLTLFLHLLFFSLSLSLFFSSSLTLLSCTMSGSLLFSSANLNLCRNLNSNTN